MNILFLTPFFSPNIGGAETFQDELIKEIVMKKTLVTITPTISSGTNRKYKNNQRKLE